MTTVRKSFNRALYEAYDKPARDAVVAYLIKRGHTIINNSEDYYVDIVSQKEGYTYFNEVEVKVAWNSDWPTHWTDIRIPERKQRLLDKHQGENGVLNFYVLNHDMTKAWRIKDTLLTPSSLKEARGRFIKKGEKFFHIPYLKAEIVIL